MNGQTPRNVEILIGGGGGPYTLFELDEDIARITIFTSIQWFYPYFLDGNISNFVDEIEIENEIELELSQQQWDDIWALVNNVTRTRANREFRWAGIDGHIDYAWAIVDGRRYWSLYDNDIENASRDWSRTINRHVNRDLLFLIYELVDSSPIPLYGGDHWPLRPLVEY